MYRIMIISLLSLVLASCGSDKEALYQGAMNTSCVVPISRINSFQQLTVFIRNQPTFFDANLKTNGITLENVKSVLPGRARINADFQNIDLGFLRDISIRAIDRTDASNVREMFYLSDLRIREGTSIELFQSLSELKSILSDPTIDIAVVLNFKAFPPTDVELELDLSYQVFTE